MHPSASLCRCATCSGWLSYAQILEAADSIGVTRFLCRILDMDFREFLFQKLSGKYSAGVRVAYALRHGEQEIPHGSVRRGVVLHRPASSRAHRVGPPQASRFTGDLRRRLELARVSKSCQSESSTGSYAGVGTANEESRPHDALDSTIAANRSSLSSHGCASSTGSVESDSRPIMK